MRWTLLLACALVMAPLTGCATSDEEPGYEVTWEQRPEDASAGEAVEMSWRVDGPEGEIPHTGVHWAREPVDDPASPADYGNTSGAQEPAQIPGTFDTEIAFEEAGTYHIRAHAIVGEGEHRWSEEVEIEVTEADVGTGNHTVTIESFAFQPPELDVEPGDQITWENQDSVTHTVTFGNETLGDSGDIAAGESYTLTVPEGIDAGTYDYVCEYHATMEASITVQTADDG